MKIKIDFVSNSSSTSFIYISKNELTLERFLDMAGIELDSPLVSMFESFYSVINEAVDSGTKVNKIEELDDAINICDMPTDTLDKIKDALKDGSNVIVCGLSSDEELHEAFLCMESFEIDSSDFLISAYCNYW